MGLAIVSHSLGAAVLSALWGAVESAPSMGMMELTHCLPPSYSSADSEHLVPRGVWWRNMRVIQPTESELDILEEIQQQIDWIGEHLHSDMREGNFKGHCVLPMFRESPYEEGYPLVSKELCDILQGYVLKSWKALKSSCCSTVQFAIEKGKTSFETAFKACRGVTLSGLDISPYNVTFQKMVEKGVSWVGKQPKEDFKKLFSSAITRQIPIKGGKPPCCPIEREIEPLYSRCVCFVKKGS